MRTSGQDTKVPEAAGAYALVQLTNGYPREVIELMETLPTVQSVEAVKGPYQLIARLAVDDASGIRRIDGVARVVTCAPAEPLSAPSLVGPPDRRHRLSLALPQLCGSPA